jgi:hypothetical protein
MTGQATDSRDGEGCGGSSSQTSICNKIEKNVFPFGALANSKSQYGQVNYKIDVGEQERKERVPLQSTRANGDNHQGVISTYKIPQRITAEIRQADGQSRQQQQQPNNIEIEIDVNASSARKSTRSRSPRGGS